MAGSSATRPHWAGIREHMIINTWTVFSCSLSPNYVAMCDKRYEEGLLSNNFSSSPKRADTRAIESCKPAMSAYFTIIRQGNYSGRNDGRRKIKEFFITGRGSFQRIISNLIAKVPFKFWRQDLNISSWLNLRERIIAVQTDNEWKLLRYSGTQGRRTVLVGGLLS